MAPGHARALSDEQERRLVALGLVERRRDRLDLTDLGEVVRAALAAGSRSRGRGP